MHQSSAVRPLVALSILLLLLLAPAANFAQSPEVGVITVEPGRVSPVFDYVAKTKAYRRIKIMPRVSGVIIKNHFGEGVVVEKDQLLYELDKERYQIRVRELQAAVMSADAKASNARSRYERASSLVSKSALSQYEVDEVSFELQVAEAELASAQASLADAELDLRYTEIRAPSRGVTGETFFFEGDLVQAQQDVLTELLTFDPMEVSVRLDAKKHEAQIQNALINGISDDILLELLLPNRTLYKHQGTIAFSASSIDEKTGTLLVKVEFPNPDQELLAGMNVTLRASDPTPESHLMIPESAMREDQRGRHVYIVGRGDKVERRDIVTGARVEGSILVKQGLEQGDRLIVRGQGKVRPGQEVTVNDA